MAVEAEERTFWELILHYGLFLGGIFQLVCILAIVVVPYGKLSNAEEEIREKEINKNELSTGQVRSQRAHPKLRERKKRK